VLGGGTENSRLAASRNKDVPEPWHERDRTGRLVMYSLERVEYSKGGHVNAEDVGRENNVIAIEAEQKDESDYGPLLAVEVQHQDVVGDFQV
jgi:hypothetical protein